MSIAGIPGKITAMGDSDRERINDLSSPDLPLTNSEGALSLLTQDENEIVLFDKSVRKMGIS